MSEKQNNNEDKNKKENDPYDFFKLTTDEKDDRNKNGPHFPFLGIIFLAIIIIGIFHVFTSFRTDTELEFSEFRNMVDSGKIVEVVITEYYIIGFDTVSKPAKEKPFASILNMDRHDDRKAYKTVGHPDTLKDFTRFLDEKNIKYSYMRAQNNLFTQILINMILPVVLLIIIYVVFFRKIGNSMGGGMGSLFGVGGSRAKSVEEGKVKTRFADVAGVDEAKDELVEVVDFLKSPKKYTDIGGKIPKGVLLVGPPGTGKTLLARAVAGEAGVPFFSISGSDFVEMFVGVGASRVRDLFKQAREKAPCIVFIDEIDALGKSRVNGFGGGNDEREQTLNQLLVEMDGFENEKGLIILAATNRADILDPALLRPGRFDRQVPVERPDVKGREEILRIHAKNVKLDDDVDFESIAHGTTGFAGADLANVVNEAALLAVRNGRKKVSMLDFNEAIDKVSIGLKKKSRKDNKKEMKLVAVHETGHALVGAFTPDYPPVNKITVVPRSHGVGGFTQHREQEEKNFWTKKDMINEVDSFLGGRAAEEIMLGDISTGASNDIARATELVKSMIVDYGMSDRFKNMTLGKGVLGNRGGEPALVREFSEDTQKYVDDEISRIMDERYEYVLKLLKKHKGLLEKVSKKLLEVETLEGKDFYALVEAEKKTSSKGEKTEKPEEDSSKKSKKTGGKKAK
ncbi:ATP-dependent zinc metalloprotease FtsH [Treponema sp.]|uniref:ATP-dependent zinc metalloprotease FtsH n=1 Tax=Treponema sp. TaxID=166 RepID=UPI00298E9E18|nr:ATP-dependent zinc metalloprotease FtsH [Treponema sp.]MCR5613869.1 ATP-dependent zinc metalloprotease FtsH [Treponema sp.]